MKFEKNIGESFRFAKKGLIKGSKFNWFFLVLTLCVPIINFITAGAFLKIFRGEEPNTDEVGKLFKEGFFYFLITISYLAIPLAIIVSSFFVPNPLHLVVLTLGILMFILSMLLRISACYIYANNGFKAAFSFKNISALIKKVGWGRYIFSLIGLDFLLWVFSYGITLIIGMLIGVVFVLLTFISPLLGILVLYGFALVFSLLFYTYVIVIRCRFIANLFRDDEEVSVTSPVESESTLEQVE